MLKRGTIKEVSVSLSVRMLSVVLWQLSLNRG